MLPEALAAMGPPDLTLTRKAVSGAVVYAWVRGDVILYVGSSLSLDRPTKIGQHHRLAGMQDGDEVLIWRAEDADAALALERDLILGIRPPLNRRVPGEVWRKVGLMIEGTVYARAWRFKVESGMDIGDIVTEALDEYLKKRGA